MVKYLRLPLQFDAPKMQAELNALSNAAWLPHYQKLHYEGDWAAIPLRSVGGKSDDIIISPLKDPIFESTVYLNECSYIQEVLAAFKFPLKAVRLLKLDAGAIIKEHRDIDLAFEKGEIRLHVPVITDPAVEFYLDKERIHLQEGECWYMNFNLPHSINNKSNVNRVHLVIDGEVNEWVKNIFNDPSIAVKKEIEDMANTYDAETKRQMIMRFRDMNTEKANELADALEKELAVQSTTI
jgi:hypothetical protein